MRHESLTEPQSMCAAPRLSRRVVLVTVSTILCGLAACAPSSTAHPGSYYPNITQTAHPTATIAPLGYTVAAWPADTSPVANTHHTLYVAFRNSGNPVARAQVTLTVKSGSSAQLYGPQTTGANGYAVITFWGVAERPNQLVLVSVTVIYDGRTFSTATDFTPAP